MMILRSEMRAARFIRTAGGTGSFFRVNEDYGEGWTKKVDEAREEDDADDGRNIIDPIDTAEYCERPTNIKYWKEMGDDSAAKDFQAYIKKVKCNE